MQAIAAILLDGVRRLDEDARALTNGHHTGLAGSAVKRYEDRWSATLVDSLCENGWQADSQTRYPGTRKRCDIVVDLSGEQRAWIEVKTAWKSWFNREQGRVVTSNPFYRKYLVGPEAGGLDTTHSLAQDFLKLNSLTPGTDQAAVLLIGFDRSAAPMHDDVAAWWEHANVAAEGWRLLAQETWPDRAYSDCRVSCWCWARGAHQAIHHLTDKINT